MAPQRPAYASVFQAGCVSGVVGGLITAPTDLVKVLMSVPTECSLALLGALGE